MILLDFAKAAGQLGDPRFTRILWIGIALTVALLVACYAAMLWAVEVFATGPLTLPVIGTVTWIGDLLGWGSLFLVIFFSTFLMVPVASAITSLFLDDVADAVEALHYPNLPAVPRMGFAAGMRETLGFLALLVVANLLATGLYVAFPPATPLIFYGMNGFLLGREYFQFAAMCHLGRDGAQALRRRHSLKIWAAGCLMALPLSIPLVNLVIPILGAATFTHMYHRLAATDHPE